MSSMSYRRIPLAPAGRAVLAAFLAVCAVLAAIGACAQASTLPTVTIGVGASSVTVGGSLQSGAVNVMATSTKKETEIVLFLLKPGSTVAEVEAFAKSSKQKDPNYANKYGTIAFDVEANPGSTTEAQTTLQAGQYVVLTGEGEKPVAVRTSFTVASAASPVALPTPEATVRSIDFAFRGPSTLRDGELVRFENEGFLVHMDIAFPVKSKAVAERVVKLLQAGKEKGLEKLVVGPPIAFAGPLSSGAYQQETIAAKPGWYVQACFMETQDGRVHTRLGMERVFKIIK
jgi:hypothetical protein